MKSQLFQCVLGLLVGAPFALASVRTCADSWNEFAGDISNDPQAPLQLKLVHPYGYFTGSVGGGDIDILALEVEDFHTLDSITLLMYSGETQSFLGVQNGSTWTAGTGFAVNPAQLLGWTHFGTTADGAGVNDNVYDDLAVPKNGSAGFSAPFGPGIYTWLIQDTGPIVEYQFVFQLSFVSKPFGDFNFDATVDLKDLTKWRAEYLLSDAADASGDGRTDGTDFIIWQRNVGRDGRSLITAAPEPTGAALAAVSAAALVAGRRSLRRRAASC